MTLEIAMVACAFAQLGKEEEYRVENGGWVEELNAYCDMAEQFVEFHTVEAINRGIPDDEYWQEVDWYDALEVFWAKKGSR